MNKPQLGKLLT